ncbi:MAG TPA: rhomboid family intramembrane serine protease [Verrucomicrobiae bacterium]|nr:rhomboid family intramembrane serine protease [Verrucomicrobiae bacterium]
MRSIGNLPAEAQARTFGDYLLTRGIRNQVEHDAGGVWEIWVLEDEQVDVGRALLERFRQQPDAAEFNGRAADAGRLRAAEEKAEADWRKRVHNRRRVFPGSVRHGAGPFTYALIVACVVVAVFSRLGTDEAVVKRLLISLYVGHSAGFLPEVMHGEVWRLFTPILLHFSIGHILFNMMWLFSLGSMVESAQGSGRFALLIAFFALGSNLAEYTFSHPLFGGMSGVNYGLIGYVWIRGKFDPASGLHLDQQNVVLAIGWFFLCFTGWVGPVANYAHAAGLLLGMGWGWISAQGAQRKL